MLHVEVVNTSIRRQQFIDVLPALGWVLRQIGMRQLIDQMSGMAPECGIQIEIGELLPMRYAWPVDFQTSSNPRFERLGLHHAGDDIAPSAQLARQQHRESLATPADEPK